MAGISSLGMRRLAATDQISVKQKVTAFGNKYVVTNKEGDLLFNMKEDASPLFVFLSSNRRSFKIDLYDANDQHVIGFHRPYPCCFDNQLEVSICGAVTSVVQRVPTFVDKLLVINDMYDQMVLRVKGPWLSTGECEFKLQTPTKTDIGCIKKEWGGIARELFTNADQFLITFPQDLDVRYKVAVIGACVLIDFLYYEGRG